MNENKNLSESIASVLTAKGVPFVSVSSAGTVFAYGYGIFATLTGNIQARDVHDKDMRFGVGTCNDPAESIANEFLRVAAPHLV